MHPVLLVFDFRGRLVRMIGLDATGTKRLFDIGKTQNGHVSYPVQMSLIEIESMKKHMEIWSANYDAS